MTAENIKEAVLLHIAQGRCTIEGCGLKAINKLGYCDWHNFVFSETTLDKIKKEWTSNREAFWQIRRIR